MSTRSASTTIRIPSSHGAASFVRSTIAATLDREGWHPLDAARVLLGASEAISNAVEHGSPPGGSVQIILERDPERIRLRVRDEGNPDRPVAAAPPPRHPPNCDAPHGRGLLIIDRLTDEFELRPCGRGTEAQLTFRRLHGPRAAGRSTTAPVPDSTQVA